MKKLLGAVLTLTIIMSFAACQNNTDQLNNSPITDEITAQASESSDDAVSTDTDLTSSPEIELELTMDSGTNIYAYGGGAGTINFDLDGDGILDEITFQFTGYEQAVPENALSLDSEIIDMINYDIYQCDITINGVPFTSEGEVMAGILLIGDIDSSDNQYEIMIPEFGPSGDPMTAFLIYDDSSSYLSKIYDNPFHSLSVDGSGIIKGKNRGNILHTWFYDAEYEIQNGEMKEILGENGYIMMNTEITALIDLPLQASPSDTTEAFTLYSGEAATITWTDNKSWCCIETADGLSGWFEVTDFSTINDTESIFVFDGLYMAD